MTYKNRIVRFTASLPAEYIDELKLLAEEKAIPSVNFGIKAALADYLKRIKQTKYEAQMREAASDKDFLARTITCDNDFMDADNEVSGQW
ncbi:MAG: hypothetical protein ACYCWE_02260 [Eubacteriales bacterium]